MTAKPELQVESLHIPGGSGAASSDAIERPAKEPESVKSASAHGVSTSSLSANGEDPSPRHRGNAHRGKSSSPTKEDSLAASRRSIAASSHAPSEINGIYGPSTFGALDRFKDTTEVPHSVIALTPLSTGRKSSFSHGGEKDERRPVSPSPNRVPGPGAYNVRAAIEKGTASHYRRVPSLTFNSRPPTDWVMLKNGMQVAVLTSTTVPVAPEVREGSVRSASGTRTSPSPRRASTPKKTSFSSSSARFPSSETCAPGPGAYVPVEGLAAPRTATPTKSKDANSSRPSSAKRRNSPKRTDSPSQGSDASPGPGAYFNPATSTSFRRQSSTKSTFAQAVRESNLPVTKEETTAGSSRPQLASWVQPSSNAFLRRSQERWTGRNSQTPSQASSPKHASTSQASSPVAAKTPSS